MHVSREPAFAKHVVYQKKMPTNQRLVGIALKTLAYSISQQAIAF
jgi:hypothetical protein